MMYVIGIIFTYKNDWATSLEGWHYDPDEV